MAKINNQEIFSRYTFKDNQLKKLEKDISYLGDKAGFCIISVDDEVAFKKRLKEDDYTYLPVFGRFQKEGSEEIIFKSVFIIFNLNQDDVTFYQTCKRYKEEFNQEHYMFCFNQTSNKPADNYTLNEIISIYFMAIAKDDLIFNGLYINPFPKSVAEMTLRKNINEVVIRAK